jgi:hypothetical protein
MVAMNSRIDFQGAAARSLFELLLDIKILAADKTGDLVEKFHAFPEIEKFRVAKNIVSFCNSHPNDAKLDDSRQRAFVNEQGKQQTIDHTIVKHWGTTKKGKLNRPEHWTGKNVQARARNLGLEYEELYVEVYSLLSWYIHSGSTGYAGLSEETIEEAFGLAHIIAGKVFLEATRICAEQKISKVIEGFRNMLDRVRLFPGKVLLEEQIKILKGAKTK